MSSTPAPPDLSVVVLCYRSENYVRDFVAQIDRELQPEGIDYELVLVANFDKNSGDRTPEIVKELGEKNPHYRYISKEKEGRMGWDMRSGLEAARGQMIAVIDGDGQMPLTDISIVYHILRSGRYEMVLTYRAKRFDGFYRNLMSRAYNGLFRLLYRPKFPIPDINSKPKIMTRAAYEKLSLVSNDWFTDAEIMIEAISNRFRICTVSTVFYKNERRRSFVDFRTVFEFVYNLFYYKFILKKGAIKSTAFPSTSES